MATYDQIMRDLKRGSYAPLYMLYGEEPFYIDKVADYIEQNALDEMAREFDLTIAYGKDYERDMGPIISAARRFPMMGQRQVIIVREAQMIKSWTPLEFYLEQVMPTTVLVFCYKYGKPDKRLKAFKNIENVGGIMMESAPLRDSQLYSWIINYVEEWSKEHNRPMKIDMQAVAIMAENIGNNLTTIAVAIEKLVAGSPATTTLITPDLVERNIGISKDYNVFELQKALTQNDVLKANRIVQYFAQSKDHPIQKEITVLFGFFQKILIYHYMPDKSQMAIAKDLEINPYFVKDYEAAARRFSAGKALRIIGYIRETDARSKGIDNASAGDYALWQELIYKILH